MALTGRPDGPPLGPPAALVPGLRALAERLRRVSARIGREVDVDPLALLGERAAVAGLTRGGRVSCGRATRLVRAADAWLAVTLARPDDVAAVPAWLGVAGWEAADGGGRELSGGDAWMPPAGLWSAVGRAVRDRSASEAVERAGLLGLPVAALGPARAARVSATQLAGAPPSVASLENVLVVDLGSLWAGPLCGSLLAAAGARVVKVEATGRPDGARSGPARFFDLMNAGKRSLALDFASRDGAGALRRVIERADVVIEASRPRALEQLGIDAAALTSAGRPRVWVSITGHGRGGPGRQRAAFGDDAAVAGGLVCVDGGEPCFCADAVADPATGLAAAAACLEALAQGGSWLLDVPLAGVAASLAGPTLPSPAGVRAAPPRARPAVGSAPALGADNAELLGEWGISA